jgi:WD40 repeat protein
MLLIDINRYKKLYLGVVMKTLKNYILKQPAKILVFFGLMAILLSIEIMAMKVSEGARRQALLKNMAKKGVIKQQEKKRQEKESGESSIYLKRTVKLEPNEYFIYPKGSEYGVILSQDALSKNKILGATFQNVLGDRKIPIIDSSLNEIKLLCDILKTKDTDKEIIDKLVERSIQNFTLGELVHGINFFDYLGLPDNIINIFLVKIKSGMLNKNADIDSLKDLDSDLWERLMVVPVTYLKTLIIQNNKKYVPEIKSEWGDITFDELVFSPDGNKIICYGKDKLILWDIKDLQKLNPKFLITQDNFQQKLAIFSPDSKKIVSIDEFRDLWLWDVSDLNAITSKKLGTHKGIISAAFSPDGKKIISCGDFARLILWDISDLTNQIVPPKIITESKDESDVIISVAFHPEGKKIATCRHNITLWNINNLNKITSQVIMSGKKSIEVIAFSPDGKKLAYGSRHNLGVWDIEDLKHSTLLIEGGYPVRYLVFSSDSNILWLSLSRSFGVGLTSFCDVSDLKTFFDYSIRFKEEEPDTVIAFSPDGNKVAGRYNILYSNFFLYTLTNDQLMLLNKIKEYTPDQKRLLYELYVWSSNDQKIPSDRLNEIEKIFQTLPPKMQELLYNRGFFRK